MSFADELRKKSDSAPKEEKDSENRYMNEMYRTLKEGVVRCFMRKCYEEASRGETAIYFFAEFINLVGIIHQQERMYVKETDFVYLKHVLRTKRAELAGFIMQELKKNELKKIKVKVAASRAVGYYVKISASW